MKSRVVSPGFVPSERALRRPDFPRMPINHDKRFFNTQYIQTMPQFTLKVGGEYFKVFAKANVHPILRPLSDNLDIRNDNHHFI
jgi:hypothetical protein